MPTRIQIRRDTNQRWTSIDPVLGIGEPALDIDTGDLVAGDGQHRFGERPFYPPFDRSTLLPREDIVAAFDARWRGATVNAASFGAVGDGVTDNAPALQAAIAATPDGGTLLIPGSPFGEAAARYLVAGTGLTNTNPDGTTKSLRVLMHGATVIKGGNVNGRLFSMSGTWEATTSVSGLTSGTAAEAGFSMPTVTATHSGTMPWKRGDVVKLFSDDTIPGVRDASSRSGQFLTVYSTSSGATTFVGVLRDQLTTNVRMARLPVQTVQLEGGVLDVTDDYLANGVGGPGTELIAMTALHGPSVKDVLIRRTVSQCIAMLSNWRYLVEGVSILWAQNDGATLFGYGVNNSASEGGYVSGCLFAQTRHGYTDTNEKVSAGADTPSAYGRSVGDTIVGCVSDSATTAGFDAHQGGEGHTFIGCVAYGSPLGFSLRGRKHTIVGCSTHGSASGLRIFTESDGLGQTWGHHVSDFTINGATNIAIEVAKNYGTNPNAGNRETRSDSLSNIRVLALAGKALNIFNATVIISNLLVEYSGAVPASACTFTNSWVTATNQRWDLFNAQGANSMSTLFDAGTTTDSRLEFDGVRVVGFSGISNRIARVFQNTATTNLLVDRLRMDYAPGSAWYAMTTAAGWVHYDTVLAGGVSSAYLPLTSVTAADLAPIGKTREDPVVEVTLSAAATIASLPQPQRQGQKLLIVNNSASAALTVTNGATAKTQLTGETDKTLTAGQSILLEANASALWRQVTTI